MTLRTHIVGCSTSCADLVAWVFITTNRAAVSWVQQSQNNVTRWYKYIEDANTWARKAVKDIMDTATQEKKAAQATLSTAGASYDIDLPDIEGSIVTRFPPEPSGYLHIGHAKAALLNDYFAHVRPGGRMICRFDDTNPTNESMEFQESILYDLKLMGIVPDKITHSSDYFQQMYDYAIQLIKDGKAFADDAELGKGDTDRRNRLPSKRRDMSIQETLERFNEMKKGFTEGKRWTLRARIAYDSLNGSLRDPVIYRCNDTPHHRTGEQWKIYPMYDFCAPILDSIEGITLALRTNEYRDRNAQYQWMQNALGLRAVPIWDFSRLNFIRTVLSKRKLTKIVAEGRVSGWDDPRMPTIRGILRRGVVVPALREFILKQGPSRNVINLQWGAFWATNRKAIDPVAARHTAIEAAGVVRCHVNGAVAGVMSKAKHAKNAALGDRKVVYGNVILLEQADARDLVVGEEITLMNWGNAIIEKIVDGEGVVEEMDMVLNLDGDFKKTKKKLTWLAEMDSNLVPVDLVSFDHLITKDKLEKTDKLEEFLTPVTEFRTEAFSDCNVAGLERGAIIQFERKGYFRLDVAYTGQGSRAVFFEVPFKA